MVFKRSEDLKFYLYISTSKTRMLHGQLTSTTDRKNTVEWNVKLPIVSVKRNTTTDKRREREEMVKGVVEELEKRDQLGSLKKPKSFIRDVFPVRWGLYDDCNSRPEEEPALVYFGGLHDGILLGMGGSSCHVVGHEGATSTWSRSATPTLTRWLLSGLHKGERPKPYIPFGGFPQEEEHEVYVAMALALHYLRPPTQQVEFVAKTIAVGEVRGVESYIGVDSVKAVLATPLYVAQGELFNDNQLWGLSDEDWLLDDGHKPRTTKISRPRGLQSSEEDR